MKECSTGRKQEKKLLYTNNILNHQQKSQYPNIRGNADAWTTIVTASQTYMFYHDSEKDDNQRR